MAKVITFGEIMLRLSTPGYLRFGIDTEFVTRFPDNDMREAASATFTPTG